MKPCASVTDTEVEATMQKLLELFCQSLIDDDTVSVRKTLISSRKKDARRNPSTAGPRRPSVITDAERDPCAKDKMARAIGTQTANDSKPKGDCNVFTYFQLDPNCKVCRMTKTTRARCENAFGIPPRTTLREPIDQPHFSSEGVQWGLGASWNAWSQVGRDVGAPSWR